MSGPLCGRLVGVYLSTSLRMLWARSGAVELTSGTSGHRRWYPGGHGRCPASPGRCADAPPTSTRRLDRYDVRVMSDIPDRRTPGVPPRDQLGRRPRDLRISVTDRCNFRCTYCMPAEIFGRDFAFLPRSEILTYEEIVRLATIFVRLGVEKLRITGGEPTVRRHLPDLVHQLAAIDGVRDLTLTTNGSALRALAAPLAEAGLRRITVSLDSLDDAVFRDMSGIGMPLARVLDGISAARSAGLAPIKINMVVRRDLNEPSIVPMARWARDQGFILRYIEYMDVGTANGWRMDDVVPAAEIIDLVDRVFPLEALPPNYPGEVATRFRYRDGAGEVGVIASVSAPFCGACTRARLSAEGEMFTCLFAARGTDLRAPLRSGADDAQLEDRIRAAWLARDDRYSDLRSAGTTGLPRVEMFAIGG